MHRHTQTVEFSSSPFFAIGKISMRFRRNSAVFVLFLRHIISDNIRLCKTFIGALIYDYMISAENRLKLKDRAQQSPYPVLKSFCIIFRKPKIPAHTRILTFSPVRKTPANRYRSPARPGSAPAAQSGSLALPRPPRSKSWSHGRSG